MNGHKIGQEDLAKLHHHHPHRIRVSNLNAEEREIYDAFTRGGKVAKGDLTARLEQVETPKRIHWRHETEKLAKALRKQDYVADLEEKARRNAKKFEYLVIQ